MATIVTYSDARPLHRHPTASTSTADFEGLFMLYLTDREGKPHGRALATPEGDAKASLACDTVTLAFPTGHVDSDASTNVYRVWPVAKCHFAAAFTAGLTNSYGAAPGARVAVIADESCTAAALAGICTAVGAVFHIGVQRPSSPELGDPPQLARLAQSTSKDIERCEKAAGDLDALFVDAGTDSVDTLIAFSAKSLKPGGGWVVAIHHKPNTEKLLTPELRDALANARLKPEEEISLLPFFKSVSILAGTKLS
jgi:hypothetical protein